jgi:hypothetical protein
VPNDSNSLVSETAATAKARVTLDDEPSGSEPTPPAAEFHLDSLPRGFGAGDLQTANRAANQSFVLALALGALMSQDPAVRAVGAPAFRLGAFVHPFLCAAIVYNGALRGAGDARFPMIFSLIGGILIRTPLAYLGGVILGSGLIGAWCGMWGRRFRQVRDGLSPYGPGRVEKSPSVAAHIPAPDTPSSQPRTVTELAFGCPSRNNNGGSWRSRTP